MENVVGSVINHKPRCGELERLAAAAATLDYTSSSLSPLHPQTTQEDCSRSVPLEHQQTQMQVTHISRNVAAAPSHVVSYIDTYQIPKNHQLVQVRNYEGQSYVQNHSTQTMQPIAGSRVLMVASNGIHQTSSNVHFGKHGQFISEELPYPAPHEEENNIHTTYSEPIPPPDPPQVIHHYRSHDPSLDPMDMDQYEETSVNGVVDKQGTMESTSKDLHMVKRGQVDSADFEDDAREKQADAESFSCKNCKISFDTEEAFKQHQQEHQNTPKRNGLVLEMKIEIIKRIQAGERKADIADEYEVNASTIKTIMKKADSYLACWKKGLFNPDSKRLKGAKREDVEEALFSWYKQAIGQGTPVTGPILCAKASDFAKKLGHSDFKPTHGWLDRFKKRKKIMLGRGNSKRRQDEKVHDCFSSVLPQLQMDYDACDIFAMELFGLYYRPLPSDVDRFRGNKCAGGIKSKDRLSIVLCTNMTGSEKFPLLVVGRTPNSRIKRNLRSTLVHYAFDKYSWFTSEIIASWLLDIDSWFVQQGRKIILLAPQSPIYPNPLKLRAVQLIRLPQGFPPPLHQVVLPFFKKCYRKKYLEEVLTISSRKKDSQPPKPSIIRCLQHLIISWQCLSDNVIVTSFQRSGLTKYGVWGMAAPPNNQDFANVQELFMNAIHVLEDNPSPDVTFEEFVHFDDEVQVCNLMGDDDIVAKVKGLTDDEDDSDGENDDKENDCAEDLGFKPASPEVKDAIEVLRKYVQYQEGAQEMFRILAHLEYLIYRKSPDHVQLGGTQIVH